MTDIVENLKEGLAGLEIQTELQPLLNEAADEITRLRAENERLREALTPFAEEAKNWDAYEANNDLWDGIVKGYKVTITMSDCRRAAAALKEND